jgi:23S rRNA (adenine2030-N6)-methyltransferase
MLSYRHAFHAGNFADVLKHVVLIRILAHLASKPKPFCCIDTHAGSGQYDLSGLYALKNREFDAGIGRLWERRDLPDIVADYVAAVRALNGGADLRRYPGSPFLERMWLRRDDRLLLFELHTSEFAALERFADRDSRIEVANKDGFAACPGLLPPPERRGLVLIDPSYEIKTDYRRAADTLARAYRRFPTGVYALWYPVVERRRANALERTIQGAGIPRVQLFELGVCADAARSGMTASGVIVVNPPWTLMGEMREVLPYLAEVLAGEGGQGFYRSYDIAGE